MHSGRRLHGGSSSSEADAWARAGKRSRVPVTDSARPHSRPLTDGRHTQTDTGEGEWPRLSPLSPARALSSRDVHSSASSSSRLFQLSTPASSLLPAAVGLRHHCECRARGYGQNSNRAFTFFTMATGVRRGDEATPVCGRTPREIASAQSMHVPTGGDARKRPTMCRRPERQNHRRRARFRQIA